MDPCGPSPQRHKPFEVSCTLPPSFQATGGSQEARTGHAMSLLVSSCREHELVLPVSLLPFDSIRGWKSKQDIMERTMNMKPEDLGTNPGVTPHRLTRDQSINLSGFPLPIREWEMNIHPTGQLEGLRRFWLWMHLAQNLTRIKHSKRRLLNPPLEASRTVGWERKGALEHTASTSSDFSGWEGVCTLRLCPDHSDLMAWPRAQAIGHCISEPPRHLELMTVECCLDKFKWGLEWLIRLQVNGTKSTLATVLQKISFWGKMQVLTVNQLQTHGARGSGS